jgi:hypothetical protein
MIAANVLIILSRKDAKAQKKRRTYTELHRPACRQAGKHREPQRKWYENEV